MAMYPYAKGSLHKRSMLPGMQGQMMDPSQGQMDPRMAAQMQGQPQGQPVDPAMAQQQMDPAMAGQQMDPRMMQAQMRQQQQMQEQQTNMQQTQDANQSAFPQGQQHQIFIQEALKQGYSPDVVMNFIAQQLGQKR